MTAAHPHALVTGCSSGIGLAITRHLLDNGWQVTGLSRTRPQLEAGFEWLQADLSKPQELPAAVKDVGNIRAFVHAAGFQRAEILGRLDGNALREMFAVHVDAAATLADALVERLENNGRILLIGSRTMSGNPGKSQYAATKAALVGLGRSWAMELAPRGITVNIIAPGPTDTPMLSDPGRASVPPRIPPLGSLVDPRDVTALAGLVLGPHGKSITGQQLTICGGASL
ncbi:SDR family NAD(P)-dependent oxidoreductase [Arthrobacter mobilis]|uniref:SDR family oxidoreductase n=1 Tax=Arthrobacter mobilis TaxID=2724944 RepID=A0A7X6HE41_9MICC|nr:SDR family oxidoreductase [Arthrobacter mobilis]NKX54765.1 SDR family oxidoreductase [Arthrobacter mobilis]